MTRLFNDPKKRIKGYWQVEIIATDPAGKKHQAAWNGAPDWIVALLVDRVFTPWPEPATPRKAATRRAGGRRREGR